MVAKFEVSEQEIKVKIWFFIRKTAVRTFGLSDSLFFSFWFMGSEQVET